MPKPPRFLLCSIILLLGLTCIYACGGGSSGGSPPPPVTPQPPTFTKAFAVANVALNGTTSLTFTLSNPNTGASLSGIGFTDTMPAGLMVATPNGLTGSCGGGTITAVAGSASVSLSSATLAAGATCSFTVNVSAVAAGMQNNTTTAVTSTEGGSGGKATASITVTNNSQQPAQPTDVTPINLDIYYILNQNDGLQADLNNGSTSAGDHIIVQQRSFTSLSQRWQFTKLAGTLWQIGNTANGLCLDSASSGVTTYVVQNACAAATTVTQQWNLTSTSNGYYTVSNKSTGLLMDVGTACVAAGACVIQTSLSGSATQSQQWLLRPAFFRGVDNALLEKQEAARAAYGVPWWKDTGGQQEDVLQILKNHGVNMVRLRPSSVPPYVNVSQVGCSASTSCYGETEAQDLDLAKRAKDLGLSLQLTLLFDGASSASVPSAWAADTPTQLQTDLYNYVKAEIMAYRQAGTMPDMVAVGNEVNNGFLGPPGSLTTSTFPQFALLQIQAMKAVKDAAADTTIGPAIPAPLTCIHITPDWDLTGFFTLANQSAIPYDAICQSYYPFYHGPLTAAQAAASNPNNKPVEQVVLANAANTIGKPILILETGEHYENGFGSNDPWYTPPTPQSQNQFLLDLRGVVTALPNHLAMGVAYWDAAGVNVPNLSGGFINGDNQADAIYAWSGLTLFDNADSSGTTNVNDPNYSTPLEALDALGNP